MKITRILFLLVIVLQTSCIPRLSVQTQILDHEQLASYAVDTPDLRLYYPRAGQRLFISWFLPKEVLTYGSLQLHLRVIFRDYTEDEVLIPIQKRHSYYLYQILSKKYCETGGILAYKVEIIGNGCILEEWRHPLWIELIKFDKEEKSEDCSQESEVRSQ